ncbi:MAG: hypothetical protein U0168_26395 [Nannocystaceae bacterium]
MAQLTMQLLAKDLAARPRDAAALADAIEALLRQARGAAIDAVPTGAREPSSDAIATAMIDDIAARPTAVPGASDSTPRPRRSPAARRPRWSRPAPSRSAARRCDTIHRRCRRPAPRAR